LTKCQESVFFSNQTGPEDPVTGIITEHYTQIIKQQNNKTKEIYIKHTQDQKY